MYIFSLTNITLLLLYDFRYFIYITFRLEIAIKDYYGKWKRMPDSTTVECRAPKDGDMVKHQIKCTTDKTKDKIFTYTVRAKIWHTCQITNNLRIQLWEQTSETGRSYGQRKGNVGLFGKVRRLLLIIMHYSNGVIFK